MPETRNRIAASSIFSPDYYESSREQTYQSKILEFLFIPLHGTDIYRIMNLRRKQQKSVNKFPLQVSQCPEFKSSSVQDK